jgi:predicted regulator of Ras-like GTPase activity (Roadblock/LC7/MglB family)
MGELFRSLVISEDDGDRLTKQLAKLNIESGAGASLLVEESSGIIASAGTLPAGDHETLGAVLACNFTAAQELAGNLAGASFAGTVQRGKQWVLRSMRVDQRRFVVTACGRGAASRKVRDAMLYARGALGAQLRMTDQMSPNRLRQAHEVFSSVTNIAVNELRKA